VASRPGKGGLPVVGERRAELLLLSSIRVVCRCLKRRLVFRLGQMNLTYFDALQRIELRHVPMDQALVRLHSMVLVLSCLAGFVAAPRPSPHLGSVTSDLPLLHALCARLTITTFTCCMLG
jgi:hypothetical protein